MKIDLPAGLVTWVEATVRNRVRGAAPHFAGASRSAWTVDIEQPDGGSRALFLLQDKGHGRGSARDAAVLRALAATPVPVPEVIDTCDECSAILLERLPGRSDFPAVEREADREPTARHLMELTGELHRLDPTQLAIPHLELPAEPEDCARTSLAQARAACDALGATADPFFSFALDWLDCNVPAQVERYSLVHSDMGPGNFLYADGQVTGIVDWEVAHFGDPMEDLAAIAVRDMATPVGSLSRRFREYETSSDIRVDLGRVHYYRALVLVRNSLMIGLGLAQPPEGFDVIEMTMYQTLLMRAAALVLCDNLDALRPRTDEAVPHLEAHSTATSQQTLIAAIERDLGEALALGADPGALRSVERVRRGLAALTHAEAVGSTLDRRERDDTASLVGVPIASGNEDPDSALRYALAETARPTDSALARYFARRMHRLAERRRPLMGELFERLPQPLEPA